MKALVLVFYSVLITGFFISLTGCGHHPVAAPQELVSVAVSHPVEREVTDYTYFTGRTAAVDSVELRARVWGYLEKVNFQEGAIVKKGDILFEIEPNTYQTVLEQAEGTLKQIEARLVRLEADVVRGEKLVTKGVVAQEEFDRRVGDRNETAASIAAAKATVERAKLDVQYTKVVSPIDGRISRYFVTTGNLVQAGDQGGGTLLTTIVSVDPMYAYFDVDEYTALRVRKLVREGKADSPRDGGFPVSMGLANEEGHPHQGTINFVENQVSPKTGTIRLRGVFPNANQVLLPGFFARVRLPIGRPHQALLVSDRALDTDQGQKILYVLNEKDEVVSRPVSVGALTGSLREITEGLKSGDRVIVNGLQHVRPGMTVKPDLVDMPGNVTTPSDESQEIPSNQTTSVQAK